MAQEKRQSECSQETNVKRVKTVNELLRIDDQQSTESDYEKIFHDIANELINHYELFLDQTHQYRLNELEFYYYEPGKHADSFAHQHPEQKHHSNWYFHRQGTSPTAAHKAGTYKGLDITFGSLHHEAYGGILIRSISNRKTNEIIEGSCLVVETILKLCKSQTIKELIETRLNFNLNVFDPNSVLFLRQIDCDHEKTLISSPRVGLTLKVPSIDRERFLFRPYRFTPDDYFPSKSKITVSLALVAKTYFQQTNTKKKFVDFSFILPTQAKLRPANFNEMQKGFEADVSKKSSPLVDFHKKTFNTSDLAKAYGIWIRNYQ